MKIDKIEVMPSTTQVAEQIAKKTGLSVNKAQRLLKAIITEITTALAREEEVSIRNLGRFKVHHYPSKSIIDPRGRGYQIITLPTKGVRFKPAWSLRKAADSRKGQLHRFARLLDEKGQEITTPPEVVDTL